MWWNTHITQLQVISMYYSHYSTGENNEFHMRTGSKIYTICKNTNYGYKSLNIRSPFLNVFLFFYFFSFSFIQYLAWLQTLKYTFVYKSTYFLKIFAVTQHFSYSFKHNCFVCTKYYLFLSRQHHTDYRPS